MTNYSANIDHKCAVCGQVVALGDAYFYTFTTGEYRHRACGLGTGRTLEELVSPARSHTPPDMYEEIERLRVVNTDLLAALRYARRHLNVRDHDLPFVDAAIAKATGGLDGILT